MADVKAADIGNRSVLLFHSADLGPARPFPQQPGEFIELTFIADSADFHSSIVEIADIAVDIQRGRCSLDEVPEADALHSSTNKKTLATVSARHAHIVIRRRCLTAYGIRRIVRSCRSGDD